MQTCQGEREHSSLPPDTAVGPEITFTGFMLGLFTYCEDWSLSAFPSSPTAAGLLTSTLINSAADVCLGASPPHNVLNPFGFDV